MLLTIILALVAADMDTLSRLGCAEAGSHQKEVKRVLRVVLNRSLLKGTTPGEEARRKWQFNTTRCKRTAINDYHVLGAMAVIKGTLRAPERVLNNSRVTHFAAKWALKKPHPRCKGFTTQEVWQRGFTKVLSTDVNHVYFRIKKGGKSGCPKKGEG